MNGQCALCPMQGTSSPCSFTIFCRNVHTKALNQNRIDARQAARSWRCNPSSPTAASRSFFRHARFSFSVFGIAIPVFGQIQKR